MSRPLLSVLCGQPSLPSSVFLVACTLRIAELSAICGGGLLSTLPIGRSVELPCRARMCCIVVLSLFCVPRNNCRLQLVEDSQGICKESLVSLACPVPPAFVQTKRGAAASLCVFSYKTDCRFSTKAASLLLTTLLYGRFVTFCHAVVSFCPTLSHLILGTPQLFPPPFQFACKRSSGSYNSSFRIPLLTFRSCTPFRLCLCFRHQVR